MFASTVTYCPHATALLAGLRGQAPKRPVRPAPPKKEAATTVKPAEKSAQPEFRFG